MIKVKLCQIHTIISAQLAYENNKNLLDFVVNGFLMKMFKTNNMEIVRTCQEHFRFRLPSDLVASRSKKLESDEFVRLSFSCRLCPLFKLVKFIVSIYCMLLQFL